MTLAANKTCIACGEPKPLTDAHFYRSHGSGFQARCKPCSKLRDKVTRITRDVRSSDGGFEKISAKICPVCCGLPWRVEGRRCHYCKTQAAAEPAVELDVSRRFTQPWYG